MQPNRRQFLLASGVALAGAGGLSGAAAAETSDAPTPGDPSQYGYPTMGNDSDAPVATVFGSFDCPYTADMVENSFAEIVEEFVDPGRLQLTFRPLEYDENGDPYISDDGVICGQAAGGVWQEDPEAFWDFFAEVWKHQPGDMSEDKIEGVMKDAGVDDAEYIADNLENWDPELRETADDAQEEDVNYIPTIELKGDWGNRENVVEWIERRLDDEDEGDGSEESGDEDGEGDEDGSQESEDGGESAEEDDENDSVDDSQESDGGDEEADPEQSDDGSDEGGRSDDEDGSEESGGSEDDGGDDGGSDGTGSGSGSVECGDGNWASDQSHGEDAQTTQSFVFPEASGDRRFL